MSDSWCEALFASWLQPSDAPTPDTVAEAISRTVRQFGTQGCAGRMAQEFGDHPEAAAKRMRWVRQLAAAAVLAQVPRGRLTQPPGAGNGPGAELRTSPMLVLVAEDDRWWITAQHNVVQSADH